MKLLSIFSIIVLLASCKPKTNPNLSSTIPLSDTLNYSLDSLAFYFPVLTFSDRTSLDSFVQNWYSSALYSFREPVLSQNYIGHNIYRFLWLRSFHRPVVFTLHQNEDRVWLNTKMLDRQPRFYDDRFGGIPKKDQEEYFEEGFIVDKQNPDLLVRIADRKANIIYNKSIPLSTKKWIEFEKLLANANFWKLPTRINDGSTDGVQWVIEGRLKNKYHVVDYHSPFNNEYAKAGYFLITLSGFVSFPYFSPSSI